MSILDDYLKGDLEHLPNDTHSVPLCAQHRVKNKHLHPPHQTNASGGTLGQQTPHPVKKSDSTQNQNEPIEKLERHSQSPHSTNRQTVTTQAMREQGTATQPKNAADFLAGNTPGVMAFYAPEELAYQEKSKRCSEESKKTQFTKNEKAKAAPQATYQDNETVERLMQWREESAY